MKKQLAIGLLLFSIGLLGVLSILTMDIPLPIEAKEMLQARFSSKQIQYLLLINPTIFLLLAVVLGMSFYKKVNLSVPIIENIVLKTNSVNYKTIIKYGLLGGVLSGVLLTMISAVFNPFIPSEFIELGEKMKPSLAARFLYGGFTEEILMRFGFMSFIVWLVSKVAKRLTNPIYWIGITIAALIFAIGHFPIVYQTVENPSSILLIYIVLGNAIGGIIFGWLYWKKGLESAFIAHIITHVIMLMGEQILSI